MTKRIPRRQFLQGTLLGTSVVVGLPLLDCFLNDNGNAYAAELGGEALPVNFGTWSWALGLTPGQWEPNGVGQDFTVGPLLQLLDPIRHHLNIFSGLQVLLDGRTNLPHVTAGHAMMSGTPRGASDDYAISLDEVVAGRLSGPTRFRSISVACDGRTDSSWSARNSSALNPAEISPAALYSSIFGGSFADPNAAQFTPDPGVMARRSILSSVRDDRERMVKAVGVRDRERLDSLFTSIRDLEQRLSLELEKPAPLAACQLPAEPEDPQLGMLVDDVERTHQLFADLMCYALACGQTRVFNVTLTKGVTELRRNGEISNAHSYTHEEQVDPELGYQKNAHYFAGRSMEAFLYMIKALDRYQEGDGTLLDRTLMYAFTEHGNARLHSPKDFMLFTVGNARGKLKTGQHVSASGETCARVALTCLHALGIPERFWGSGSNRTAQPFSELLV